MSANQIRRLGSLTRLAISREELLKIDDWAFRHGKTREEAIRFLLRVAVSQSRRNEQFREKG